MKFFVQRPQLPFVGGDSRNWCDKSLLEKSIAGSYEYSVHYIMPYNHKTLQRESLIRKKNFCMKEIYNLLLRKKDSVFVGFI